MKLTHEEAINEHRTMWRWISKESLKRKKKVSKEDYFKTHPNVLDFDVRVDPNIMHTEIRTYHGIKNNCFLCEYVYGKENLNSFFCSDCPLCWPNNFCISIFGNGLYNDWVLLDDSDYKKASRLAKEIAELAAKESY